MVNRTVLKAAADALGRLEALEAAHKSAELAPHDAFPISFLHVATHTTEDGEVVADTSGGHYGSEHGIKAYYPRGEYLDTLKFLMLHEAQFLKSIGVAL